MQGKKFTPDDWHTVFTRNRDKTSREIAEIIGKTQAAVCMAAKRLGRTVKSGYRPNKRSKNWVAILEEHGRKSNKELAEMFGVTPNTIRVYRNVYNSR
jgi:DNA-binding CsgD family transcriptional regulator